MKLNSVVILALGAALASVEAAPTNLPERDNQEVARGFSLRFGHAVPSKVGRDILEARFVAGSDAAQDIEGRSVSRSSRPCIMKKMAAKAIKISNTFRKALGLPLIQEAPEHHVKVHKGPHHNGFHHPPLPPLPFVGNPVVLEEKLADGRIRVVDSHGGVMILGGPGQTPPGRHPGHRRPGHGISPCHRASFLKRLGFALTSLGKWEGRAVAFVLGCGLGVLLRMFWVLSVITFRVLSGTNRKEEEAVQYTVIHQYIEDAETPVAPPTYTAYVDEKADGKVDDAAPVAPAVPATPANAAA